MKSFFQHMGILFLHWGGLGQFALGVLDSSFLVMPLGNDLLMIVQVAHHPGRLLYYAAMATAGSVAGCLLIDVIFRRGGQAAFEKHVPAKRLRYIEDKVKKRAAWALTVASIAPPPFPFTPFVAGAAALQYPRKRLMAVIGATRFIRFGLDGVLALFFGEGILRLAESPAVQWAIVGLIVLSIGGSALSVYGWVRRSRRQNPSRRQENQSRQAA